MFTKKKTLAFVLLLAVTAPLLFFAGFLVKQKIMQNGMEEKLETASLQTITTNIAGVKWLTKNKEAVIDGKLFDVQSYSITGSKIILTGLYDTDEDNLHEELNNFLLQKNDPNAPLNSTVIKFLFPPLYNNTEILICQNTWQQIAKQYMPYFQKKVADSCLASDIPPPRFI